MWQGSVNRRIFSALLTVGGFTFLVQLGAIGKDLVVAYQFGTGDALDAFLIALVVPLFAINVIAGSFSAAFVPTYLQTRDSDGKIQAQDLLSSTVMVSTTLLLAVSGLLVLVSEELIPLLGSGFSNAKLEMTQKLFLLLIPLLVIGGVAKIWAATLNAGERFALAALAPLLTPVSAIVLVLLLGGQLGIYALVAGFILGALVEVVVLSRGLWRGGTSLLPRWNGVTQRLRQVMRQYVPMAAGAFLLGSTILVDQAMAAMLGPGSVAVFSYGTKVTAFIVGLGAMAVGTAMLPHFSQMVLKKDWQGIRNTLKTYGQLITAISVPVTAVLFLLSTFIIGFLFERGAFTADDTRLVGKVQEFYLLQVPFYLLGTMMVRLISSLQANHVLMWGAVISLVLNVALNYVFMQLIGVAGIALSTTVVYVVSFFYLAIMLSRLIRQAAHGH